MGRDLGSLPPRVAAAMAEREEERQAMAYKACQRDKRGLALEDCIKAAAKGVFTILGNGGIVRVVIPGRSENA